MTDSLDHFLRYQIDAGHCPGALVHVERAGQVLAHRAAGRVRPGDDAPMHDGVRFRIASLSKPVVTVAALMLVDEGRLDLDAPVGELLPALANLRLKGGARPRRAPTVRDLMRHSSGLAYPYELADPALREAWSAAGFTPAMDGMDSAGFLRRLADLPLVAEPGSAFRYGYSTDVLGCIVEQLDGRPLGQALRQRLFEPLGMRHTGFEITAGEDAGLASAHADDAGWHGMIPAIGQRTPGQPAMDSGGGGLISTLGDYAAFARLLADGGVVSGVAGGGAGGQRLLSEQLFAEMARPQLPEGVDGPAGYTGPGFGFGLGLAVRHDWGPCALPSATGELTWSGISGTAMYVQPRERWFALLFSANMASRMMSRFEFRRAAGRL